MQHEQHQSMPDQDSTAQDRALRNSDSRQHLLLSAMCEYDHRFHPSDEFLGESFHQLQAKQFADVLRTQWRDPKIALS